MPRYIDCFTYNDYDRVVMFLLVNRVQIVERDKMKMLIVVAEFSEETEFEMKRMNEFDDVVTVGDSPL